MRKISAKAKKNEKAKPKKQEASSNIKTKTKGITRKISASAKEK